MLAWLPVTIYVVLLPKGAFGFEHDTLKYLFGN